MAEIFRSWYREYETYHCFSVYFCFFYTIATFGLYVLEYTSSLPAVNRFDNWSSFYGQKYIFAFQNLLPDSGILYAASTEDIFDRNHILIF